ncbi:MAG: hypothetical protein RMJ97_00190 [Raineya sp.]|nr:hypothetical protein [Raineya sp.]MDW8295279.1 hypothetical protein [Raineya sp.]
MDLSVTILNLLTKLCNVRKRMRWQIRCNYVDSEGKAVFNILFYENHTNNLYGDIAFQQSSETVLYCKYANFQEETPSNLTDLLLDLINYEKSLLATETKNYD